MPGQSHRLLFGLTSLIDGAPSVATAPIGPEFLLPAGSHKHVRLRTNHQVKGIQNDTAERKGRIFRNFPVSRQTTFKLPSFSGLAVRAQNPES
jgi:hypothetical protein